MITRRNLIADPRLITRSGWTGVGAGGTLTAIQVYSPNVLGKVGDVYTASADITAPPGVTLTGSITPGPTTGAAFASNPKYYVNFSIPAGQTQRIYSSGPINVGADGMRLLINNLNVIDGTAKIDNILLEVSSVNSPYFDGATVSTDKTIRNSWTGAVNNSISQQEILPNVARRNLCPNPSFEVDFTNWVTLGAGVTLTKSSAVTAYSGTSELSVAYTNPVTGVQTTFNNLVIGRQYIVSTPIWNPVGNPSVGINMPGLGTSSRTNTNAQWQVLSLAFVATATSHTLQLNVNGTGGSNLFYVDGVMLEEGSALGSYFDGGTPWDTNKYSWYGTANNSVSLLEPLTVGFRRNMCPNPNMESNITGWAGVNGAATSQDATLFHSGTKSCKITHAAGAGVTSVASRTFTGLTVGKVYTFSAWIYVPATTTTNGEIWISTLGAGNVISVKDQWARSSKTVTATSTSHTMYIASTGATLAGDLMYFDDVQLEEGSLTDYFDGSFGWDTNKYYWLGTANLSESFAEPITLVRRNSCLNPNLETNITWWGALSSVSAPTVSASGPYSGVNRGSAIGNNTGTSPRVYLFATYAGAKNGDTWTLQYKVKKIGTWPSGGSHYPAIRYQIVGGGEQVLINNVVTTGPDANGWFTVSSTATCTVNCDGRIQINVGFLTLSANLDVTGELAWDEVCLEKTNSALPYFDGNTLSDAATDYEWQNVVNGSESYGIARSNAQLIGRQSDIFKQLVASGYGPGSLADMEYKRLISKTGVTPPVKLSIADLYALAGEKNRIPAFRR